MSDVEDIIRREYLDYDMPLELVREDIMAKIRVIKSIIKEKMQLVEYYKKEAEKLLETVKSKKKEVEALEREVTLLIDEKITLEEMLEKVEEMMREGVI